MQCIGKWQLVLRYKLEEKFLRVTTPWKITLSDGIALECTKMQTVSACKIVVLIYCMREVDAYQLAKWNHTWWLVVLAI